MIFKRKKKQKKELSNSEENLEDEELPKGFKKSNTDKASYKIEIYECINGLPRRVSKFTAKRIIDENDYIPYLYYQNPKTKKIWLEIFPQKDRTLDYYNEKEVEKDIENIKKEIKKSEKSEYSTVNILDLKFKLKKLEAKKRTFKFSLNSSYIYLDENNMPIIKYNREGSTNIPFKWDADTSTIYNPSDNKKKSASIVLRNKENKYPNRENQVRIATMVVFVMAILLASGAGFWHYKAFKAYDVNEINKIKEQNLKDINDLNKIFRQQGNTMNNILNNMSNNIIVTGSNVGKDKTKKNIDFNNNNKNGES